MLHTQRKACMTLIQAVGSISTLLLHVDQVASGRKKIKSEKNPEKDFSKSFFPHFEAQE